MDSSSHAMSSSSRWSAGVRSRPLFAVCLWIACCFVMGSSSGSRPGSALAIAGCNGSNRRFVDGTLLLGIVALGSGSIGRAHGAAALRIGGGVLPGMCSNEGLGEGLGVGLDVGLGVGLGVGLTVFLT